MQAKRNSEQEQAVIAAEIEEGERGKTRWAQRKVSGNRIVEEGRGGEGEEKGKRGWDEL